MHFQNRIYVMDIVRLSTEANVTGLVCLYATTLPVMLSWFRLYLRLKRQSFVRICRPGRSMEDVVRQQRPEVGKLWSQLKWCMGAVGKYPLSWRVRSGIKPSPLV